MKVSELDIHNYELIRNNVSNFIKSLAKNYDLKDNLVLDIAPQIHKGTKEYFFNSKIKTLDLDPNSNANYICDICSNNNNLILDSTFNLVVCTEVLEHVSNPFKAVDELYRITKPGGVVAISTPFDFRIHGPLPDNWRFTIYGLKELFKNFKDVQIQELENPKRFLMPTHYTLIAKK